MKVEIADEPAHGPTAAVAGDGTVLIRLGDRWHGIGCPLLRTFEIGEVCGCWPELGDRILLPHQRPGARATVPA